LKPTQVGALPIDEASAETRTGPPTDWPDDLTARVWAGVVPSTLMPGEPVPVENLPAGVSVPDYVYSYGRKHSYPLPRDGSRFDA
jgi:hypothetical protein